MTEVALCPCGDACMGGKRNQNDSLETSDSTGFEIQKYNRPLNTTTLEAYIREIERKIAEAQVLEKCKCSPCLPFLPAIDSTTYLDEAIYFEEFPESVFIYFDVNRVYCQICKRRFPVYKLEEHKIACFNFRSHRNRVAPYNSAKHRLDFLSRSERKEIKKAPPPPSLMDVQWRKEHEAWIKALNSDLNTKMEFMFKTQSDWRRIYNQYCLTSEELREKGIISCPI